jgi:hypothetical protein
MKILLGRTDVIDVEGLRVFRGQAETIGDPKAVSPVPSSLDTGLRLRSNKKPTTLFF